ncbi:hypothetical protein [uncultured Muribaculum sp.]|uniref:hypothetical protein n=1 Tax=uncultured Muribaculum sp. TaxID=1918613 RepID=UPI0025AF9A4B|nr:hypothetical protein [uncultured Muribaculum sp.]
MKKFLLFISLAMACALTAYADKASDYKEYATRVRAEVWADSLPQFSAPPQVPDKYKNESAVILAAHKNISAKKKTGIGFDATASLIPFKRVALINMDDYMRTLILINDKAALEDFSEYDLPIKEGSSDWFWQEKDERKYVLGVRILKPDGRIIEVPTDDFVILSQQKKENKADRQKLAVPGLETGDKLDIFLFTHTALKNIQPQPIDIILRDKYPVLKYTIDCKIDDDLTTVYRSRNGAPELTVTQGPDKDYVLQGELAQPSDAAPQLFYNRNLQAPQIEMLIYNRRFDEYTPKFARKDGVQANPDAEETAIKDRIEQLEKFSDMTSSVKTQLGGVKGNPMKSVKEKLKKGEWTQAQAADYVYNLLVFSYMTGKYKYYPGDFVNELDAAFRQIDIKDIRKGITIARRDGTLDKAINYKDIWYFVYLPECNHYYSNAFRGYNTSSEILHSLQGQQAMFIHNKKLSKKERNAEDRWLTMPKSTPADNRRVTTINATIEGTDMNISRRIDSYGASKENAGPLLTSDNMLNAYLEYLNREGIVADPQMLRKEKAKDKAQRMERNADALREQTEIIRQETASYHGNEPKQFQGYEVLAGGIGVCPDSAAISFEINYIMDGIVKNAGRNLMLSIGKLIGEQAEIAPSQRKRLEGDDIYIAYPRDYIYEISVGLPSGYTPSETSLGRLNTELKNNAGHFISKAGIKDGKLVLNVSYEFAQTQLPASDWNKMLELVDAASKFNTMTLLLEKK